ncbi:MAG: hypothetical protein RLZZ591_1079 [Pseudomonadota bacterium]|jgi:hypothetical protein
MALKENTLSSVVEISRQFLRSIQIDDDFGREDALSGYVCQGTAQSLLESMAQQLLETKQRAFTWTGPYGGGKSSLALMLCSLVGPNQKLRDRAKKILALPSDSKIYRAFDAKGTGWTVLPVVGKRISVRDQLIATIEKRTGTVLSKKKNADVIAELVALAESNKQGLLLIIDELGKFLENAALDSTEDIYFFQQLAEAASRTNGNFVVVGILHQPFEAYATALGRQTRDDWAKIQGRYIDIPLVAATDEVIELIGQSITRAENIDVSDARQACAVIANNIKTRRPAAPKNLAESLLACWPLHPAITSLLGPISRRKFGQNERSIFGFLASREPLGFAEFLQTHQVSGDSMYRPSNYWDYLRANSEPAILASPDGHRWAQAVDSVERAEAKGQAIHSDVAKTVALIEMFRSGAALAADEETIISCVNSSDKSAVKRALVELVDWKILIERKHLNAYGVFAGSDFDIEGAISSTRNEISAFNGKLISELTDLNPVIAKRLYHETGTMRWFSKTIVPFGELPTFISDYKAVPGSVGTFVLCVPDTPLADKQFLTSIQEISLENSESPIIFGVSKNGKRVTELSHELAAAERVFTTRTELEGDSVARRELTSRISSLRNALQDELADAFRSATWLRQGQKLNDDKNSTVSAIASTVAEKIYHSTPIINSELINRDELSSNIVKARRELMYRMLKDGGISKLGYEGYPADAGLYYTVLNTPGLHMNRGRLGWGFGKPKDDGETGSTYLELWYHTEEIFKNANDKLGLHEVYALWQSAPYGLKKGVMPIIALAFFLANKAHIAIYFDNVFTPNINEVIIDELLNDPKLIKFKYVTAGENKSSLAKAIAEKVLAPHLPNADVSSISPLDTARGLVSIVVDLPNWTKRTNSVSNPAQEVRAMLLKASDPNKVLFADLPTILGSDSEGDLVEKLSSVISELQSAYPVKLREIQKIVLDSLQHGNGSIEDLRNRAKSVKGITGNFQLESFATRLEEFEDSDAAVESLISNAINKPSHSWVDRDLDAAIIQLGSLAMDFRKAEALAGLRGRNSARKVFNLVLSAGQGNDLSRTVEVSKSDQSKIDAAVAQILPILEKVDPRLIFATLADIGIKVAEKDEVKT